MKELIGKLIKSIWIDGDEQRYIRFVTDACNVEYFAEGDCCSESWFYHILGVDALLGHVVTNVEYVKNGDEIPVDAYTRQEVDLLYGINIKTTGGMADIEFRNSSNGYYSGGLVVVDDPRHNKYYQDQLAKIRFVPVLTDYTAQLVVA